MAFYPIPKARRIRGEYARFLQNDNLNFNSDTTRICSALWGGGEKRSITHLPSIFPWSKKKNEKEKLAKEKDELARDSETSACTEQSEV